LKPEGKCLFRSKLFGYIIAGVFLLLTARLIEIQYFDHEHYLSLARNQQRTKVTIPARRGEIFDCQGRTLAMSVTARSVFAEPHRLPEVKDTCEKLALALDLDPSALLERLIAARNKKFIWIKRFVSEEEAQAVRALNLTGVGFRKESQRRYPLGVVASHVIGFTGTDGHGLEGIELLFDRELSGTDGYKIVLRDGRARAIQPPVPQEKRPVAGASVVLTIDGAVQHFAEEVLDRIMQKWNPLGATIVVIQAHTGEILAMANRPTYDPNRFGDFSSDARRNRAVTDSFEPGSTFKPVIMAAALEEGVTRPQDRIFCEDGLFVYRARRLRDHHPYGWLTAKEVIAKSSNVGMAKVGLALGGDLMYRYLRNFGFGGKTGLKLPGEVAGQITPPRRYSYYTLMSVPIGQEIAVSALQLTRAFCVFANGGILVKPKIVRGLVDERGAVIKRYDNKSNRRVISARTAGQIMQMLELVVSDGTGRKAKVAGYRIAGKTGTAQKINPEGGYAHSRFVSSFICIAPAEAPRFVLLVTVNEPRAGGSYYGGTVAAPSAGELAKRILEFHAVRPAGFDRAASFSEQAMRRRNEELGNRN